MNLHQYKPCELEQWINALYQADGIICAEDLKVERVAGIFQTDVMFYMGPSFADWREGGYSVIFLDRNLPDEELRAVFFHELCHPVRHVGNQAELPLLFTELQEIQAGLFQLYASLPIYMIENYAEQMADTNVAPRLAYEFQLPVELVERRLQQIAGRIRKATEEQKIAGPAPVREEPDLVIHSPETLKMLNKLLWISAQKGRKVFRG